MNDLKLDRNGRWNGSLTATPSAVADAAGMVWSHANPAELYRWIARRNALLSTISVAYGPFSPQSPRPSAG